MDAPLRNHRDKPVAPRHGALSAVGPVVLLETSFKHYSGGESEPNHDVDDRSSYRQDRSVSQRGQVKWIMHRKRFTDWANPSSAHRSTVKSCSGFVREKPRRAFTHAHAITSMLSIMQSSGVYTGFFYVTAFCS